MKMKLSLRNEVRFENLQEAAGRTGVGSQPAASHPAGWHCHNDVVVPAVSSSSASPRSRPLLTGFGICQGICPALTNPKTCYTQYGIGVMQKPKRAQRAKQPTTRRQS